MAGYQGGEREDGARGCEGRRWGSGEVEGGSVNQGGRSRVDKETGRR